MKTKAALPSIVAASVLLRVTGAHATLRVGTNPTIQAAELQAAAIVKVAWIGAGALVLAGIAVGLGLYFGLRKQRHDTAAAAQGDSRSS